MDGWIYNIYVYGYRYLVRGSAMDTIPMGGKVMDTDSCCGYTFICGATWTKIDI